MARRKTPNGKSHTDAVFHCSLCSSVFYNRGILEKHMLNHADVQPAAPECPVCGFPFSDTLAMEKHKAMAHGTSHTAHQQTQNSPLSPLNGSPVARKKSVQELRTPVADSRGSQIHCDDCKCDFPSRTQFRKHKSFPEGICADFKSSKKLVHKTGSYKIQHENVERTDEAHNGVLHYDKMLAVSSASAQSDGDLRCNKCSKVFASQSRYNNHLLGCKAARHHESSFTRSTTALVVPGTEAQNAISPPEDSSQYLLTVPIPTIHLSDASGHDHQQTDNLRIKTRPPVAVQRPSDTPTAPAPSVTKIPTCDSLTCGIDGCPSVFRSDAGLKCHQQDNHGIGGKGLDMTGRDSWMLNQRAREQLRSEGLLRAPNNSLRGGRNGRSSLPVFPSLRTPLPIGTPPATAVTHEQPPMSAPKPSAAVAPIRTLQPVLSSPKCVTSPNSTRPTYAVAPGTVPTSLDLGTPADMEQAISIKSKILRLLIQSDIFIKHDGNIIVSGIQWMRISVGRQHETYSMFDQLCHLPRELQTEYVPPPQVFKNEYTAHYTVADFAPSPDRDVAKPGLAVVALACSKVILKDGCLGVVKVAAIDLVTCRILMNHLVCTDPNTEVKDWKFEDTGLRNWKDMEGARQSGYKVFKGWYTARTALWKFVDKETIVVGHNLRSDLDALRMVHGRAVDVARVVEKAAGGPISKKQLSLYSLARDFANIQISTDAEFGRDTLLDALAARQLGLWICKNKNTMEKTAKKKSEDYQRLPVAIKT